jgi:hypothetical protein
MAPTMAPLISPRTAKVMLSPREFYGLVLDNESTGMCSSLPITNDCETVILRCDEKDHKVAREIVLETITGELIATLDFDPAKERRTLRDADGELCAIIVHEVVDGYQQHVFKICGPKKMNKHHRRSKHSGYYTWAEVRNSSGINVRFSMKVRGHNGEAKYVTETFGPSLFKWGTPRGFVVKQGQKACTRITYLGDSRGIVVAPNVDKCLMLCFALIIEEMVENRMR